MRDTAVSLGLTLTIEDSWGGDIVTAAVGHLAAGVPRGSLFAASYMNDWTLEHVAGYEPRSSGGTDPSGRPGPWDHGRPRPARDAAVQRDPVGFMADRGGREAVWRRGSGDGRDRVERRSLARARAALGEPDRGSGQPADRAAVRHASERPWAGRSAPPRHRRRGGTRRASQPSTPATISSPSCRPAV